VIVNHVGLRVLDLERSTRFYEALGFREARTAEIPDAPSSRLLRLPEPVGLRATYLVNEGFVLELLTFDHHGGEPVDRSMAETGLTHLSLGVTDLAEAKALVAEHGGEVLDDTDLGVACMVRDPDGQLLELLHVDARPVTP
jgi:catechol 2,3-dioxygenase-like lactoylglutathione lyase family enzyme